MLTTQQKLKYCRDFLGYCNSSFLMKATLGVDTDKLYKDICALFRGKDVVFKHPRNTYHYTKSNLITLNNIIKIFIKGGIKNKYDYLQKNDGTINMEMDYAYKKLFLKK